MKNTNRSAVFFDYASTTPCCEAALELVEKHASEDFGNPSSSHSLGRSSAQAIKDARESLAKLFKVGADQIIFTGGGTEADNLAVYGVALAALAGSKRPPRILASSIEHPAVRKTVLSLQGLGCDTQLIPVNKDSQIDLEAFDQLLTPETLLVSIHQVNNILGTILPVEELARRAKKKVPNVIFHTDAVQAFGKIPVPMGGSPVDLVSISGHKIEGPKGVGALVVLNKDLLKTQRLRPLVWGGEQEAGLRSGTQNAGLIAGFGAAAEQMIPAMEKHTAHVRKLRDHLREKLQKAGLLDGTLLWSSPENGIPHIVSLCAPTLPGPNLAQVLDEHGYLVSTGSACSSGKFEPDPVLTACGYPAVCRASNLRISFSHRQTLKEVDGLAQAIETSVNQLKKLMGG